MAVIEVTNVADLLLKEEELEKRNPDYKELAARGEAGFRRGFIAGYTQAYDEFGKMRKDIAAFIDGRLRDWANGADNGPMSDYPPDLKE